jgi:glutamate racemase
LDRPIGVIDSGVGGLTVVKEMIRQLPKEEIIYIGDTARCPYGPRTTEEVRSFTWELVNVLLKKNIKMLVIACNTATAAALTDLQEKLSIPVIGVIQPGARAALKISKNNNIGVIGTIGTINSNAYEFAIKSINDNTCIESFACPAFVPLVEQGRLQGKETEEIVKQSLQPLFNAKIDTLILGCTHYPLLKNVIQKVLPNHISLISSGEETAREVSTILSYSDLLYTGDRKPVHHFYKTSDSLHFKKIAKEWLIEADFEVNNISL